MFCKNWVQTVCGTRSIFRIIANSETRPWQSLGPGRVPSSAERSSRRTVPKSRANPQFNQDTGFVGAATIAQVKLFNNHPTGKVFKEERLRALAGDGGVQECGFAQNCVEVCPKQIPLTNAISDVSRDVTVQVVKDLLRG